MRDQVFRFMRENKGYIVAGTWGIIGLYVFYAMRKSPAGVQKEINIDVLYQDPRPMVVTATVDGTEYIIHDEREYMQLLMEMAGKYLQVNVNIHHSGSPGARSYEEKLRRLVAEVGEGAKASGTKYNMSRYIT